MPPIQELDRLIGHAVDSFSRLETIGHTAEPHHLTARQFFDHVRECRQVRHGRLVGMPQVAEAQKAFRVAVGAVMRTAASVCIKTRVVPAL